MRQLNLQTTDHFVRILIGPLPNNSCLFQTTTVRPKRHHAGETDRLKATIHSPGPANPPDTVGAQFAYEIEVAQGRNESGEWPGPAPVPTSPCVRGRTLRFMKKTQDGQSHRRDSQSGGTQGPRSRSPRALPRGGSHAGSVVHLKARKKYQCCSKDSATFLLSRRSLP